MIVADSIRRVIPSRCNHFNEWLNQIQNIETTDIPSDVIDSIMLRLDKLNKQQDIKKNINVVNVLGILRKLRLVKYYEYAPFIVYKLSYMLSYKLSYRCDLTSGVPPLRLSSASDNEEKIRQMFDAIQKPFLKHAPQNTSFFPYVYVLRKFLEILGEHELLDKVSLLKSSTRHDMTWQKICTELGWPFIRSL